METKKGQQRFTEEFKIEAVKQVSDRGRPVAEVAMRLGVSAQGLYAWIERHGAQAEHLPHAGGNSGVGLMWSST